MAPVPRRLHTRDRAESREELRGFAQVTRAEQEYGRLLRKIGAHVDNLVKLFKGGLVPEGDVALSEALNNYATHLDGYARVVASRMLNDVSRRNKQAFVKLAKELGTGLREEIAGADTGAVMRALMSEQVHLITSLPREAAQRVHTLAMTALSDGSRAKEMVAEIMRTGEVTRNRATLIARTETARASSVFTQARATEVGSDGYIWRTARDTDVRPSHKKMEGKFVRWDTPPRLEDGTVTHAGQIYNCRCYAEPVIPRDL
mgnify:CR=1 FL=1